MLRTIVRSAVICILVVFAPTGSADNCYRLLSGGTCTNHGDWFASTLCSGCNQDHQCGVRVYTKTLSEEEWNVPKGVWDLIDQEGEGPEGYTEKNDRSRHCVEFGTCTLQCEEIDANDPNDPFATMWVCVKNPPQSTLSIDDDFLSGVPCEHEF
jgi:hypothetical protein